MIETAKQRGWKVLISLSSPVPKWATEDRSDTVKRPIPAEFQKFATATARRFGGPTVLWSIWNEPNLPRYLQPQVVGGKRVGGRIYRDLFLAGRDGIRAGGQTTAPVLFGELAPVGGAGDGRQYPLTFLRDALCLSSKDKFDRSCARLTLDGVAMHPYQFTGGKLNKNDVTYRVLSRLVSALDKAAKAKAINAKVPVYYTEFGIQSYPDKVFGVSPQRQYEIRARVERDAYANSRIRGFSQYLLTDDDPSVASRRACSTRAASRSRPSTRFRLTLDAKPTARAKRKRLSLWGLVRPATGATTVVIERKTGKRFSHLEEGADQVERLVHGHRQLPQQGPVPVPLDLAERQAHEPGGAPVHRLSARGPAGVRACRGCPRPPRAITHRPPRPALCSGSCATVRRITRLA